MRHRFGLAVHDRGLDLRMRLRERREFTGQLPRHFYERPFIYCQQEAPLAGARLLPGLDNQLIRLFGRRIHVALNPELFELRLETHDEMGFSVAGIPGEDHIFARLQGIDDESF